MTMMVAGPCLAWEMTCTVISAKANGVVVGPLSLGPTKVASTEWGRHPDGWHLGFEIQVRDEGRGAFLRGVRQSSGSPISLPDD